MVLRHANVVVLLGMALSAAPMVMGILFAVRPNEARLALMRPLSLAGIFVSLSNMMLGVMNALLVLDGSRRSTWTPCGSLPSACPNRRCRRSSDFRS